MVAGRCRPVHPPHRTHKAAGLGDPGEAAIPGRRRGARGVRAGPPRSPEPAVVPQPPGRSRWDPREERASGRREEEGGFLETAVARRSWGFRGLCAITSRGGHPGPRAFASHTLRGAESPASPGLRSP